MTKLNILFMAAALIFLSETALAEGGYYGTASFGSSLCEQNGYYCYKVRTRDSWDSLFPNLDERDIVMRVNRLNLRLQKGMILAIPKDLRNADIISISPFATKISAPGEKEVLVDLNKLAWAAYDAHGNLIHWGPASGGRGFCSDAQSCFTVTGVFKVLRKQTAKCVSSVYPLEYEGGAPMPYCMHFYSGFAMHGSYDVPGYNASHGCVRMFINDARWLNEHFATLGTRIVIKPYGDSIADLSDFPHQVNSEVNNFSAPSYSGLNDSEQQLSPLENAMHY